MAFILPIRLSVSFDPGWKLSQILRSPVKSLIRSFGKDRAGATAIEYGLLVSLISLAIVASLQALGPQLVAVFLLLVAAL